MRKVLRNFRCRISGTYTVCPILFVVNYEIHNKFSTRTNYYYHSAFSLSYGPVLCMRIGALLCWDFQVGKMGAAYPKSDMNYKFSFTEPDENRWNNPQQFIIKIVLLSIPKLVVQIENAPGTKAPLHLIDEVLKDDRRLVISTLREFIKRLNVFRWNFHRKIIEIEWDLHGKSIHWFGFTETNFNENFSWKQKRPIHGIVTLIRSSFTNICWVIFIIDICWVESYFNWKFQFEIKQIDRKFDES